MAAGHLHDHFASLERQTEAARLGTWLLVVSEILLFSALFALYAGLRVQHPRVFAESVRHTSTPLGAAMTFVLITSSLAVALAVHALRGARRRATLAWLGASLGLGLLFLVLKGLEYAQHWREGLRPGPLYAFPEIPDAGAAAFWSLYYLMTGLHALHVAIGLTALGACAWATWRRRIDARYQTPLEMSGLYWHLVDGIWLFLWPCLYLMH